jgi:farnesyl diphosphate synthase
MKTGALLAFACNAGERVGNAEAGACEAVGRYGRAVGQAIQIADDILDLDGDAAVVGKSTGKDAAAGKATLPALLGRDAATARLAALIKDAEAALAPFGQKADILAAAARFIAERKA